MNKVEKIVILGSGIAGLSAGFCLSQNNITSKIYEKNNDWGGLCGNFSIDGFRFDKFVHLSFTKNNDIIKIFTENTTFIDHKPTAGNYYKGLWIKHPVQNNLSPLPLKEKIKIIFDFLKREKMESSDIQNYEQWLRCQYGDYFAQNFPMEYTKKYWGVDAKELETKWVGERMHCPSLKEVLSGAFKKNEKNYYYASSMRYPQKGGFRSFFDDIRKNQDISFNKEAVKIDTKQQKVSFSDGTIEKYDKLISSLPLPEVIKILENVPEKIQNAAKSLRYTSGFMVSIGVRKPNLVKDLWFYVYDKDIPFARVYSPSIKSPDNAPEGCSSFQAEIFFDNNTAKPSSEVILQKTCEGFEQMKLIRLHDIILRDIRFEKYANIIFDKEIYKNRQVVIEYLNENKIITTGRFGKWDYFWSDQAFEDGKTSAQELINN